MDVTQGYTRGAEEEKGERLICTAYLPFLEQEDFIGISDLACEITSCWAGTMAGVKYTVKLVAMGRKSEVVAESPDLVCEHAVRTFWRCYTGEECPMNREEIAVASGAMNSRGA